MKKLILSTYIILIAFAGKAQQIAAYSADEIIKHTSSKDTVYIINFWATWCVPCVQELPEFNDLKRYAHVAVKVLLVSLDFKEDVPEKLSRFLEKKHIMPEVAWLSDTNPDVFIPKIEKTWGGSIPATIIVAPGKNFKKFMEGQVTEREVSSIVDKVLENE